MWESIGQNAGKVWHLLEQQGASSPTKIAKELEIKVSDVDRAIGWLAREDKLVLQQLKNGGVRVGLKTD